MPYNNKLSRSDVGRERSLLIAPRKARIIGSIRAELAEEYSLIRETHPEWLPEQAVNKPVKPVSKPATSKAPESWKPAWMRK